MKKRVNILGVLVLLALAAPLPVQAFEERGGDVVTIPAGEVIDVMTTCTLQQARSCSKEPFAGILLSLRET